jgi:transcriptional regulator with XRE-family HTH domain
MTNAAGIAYGELIRRQRKEKKMNQEELGALVKVGKNAVGAWEAGRSRPDVGSVPVICEALGLSLEEFFGFPDKSGETGEYSGISGEERADLLRRYGVLNPYNRQVIMRQMDMLHQMQEDTRKPRKIIRLFRNELAASAGPGETLEATRGEEVYLFADQATETADEIIRVNGNSMEPTYYDGDLVLVKHTSSVRPGEIGVFIVGDTGYIKEYQKDGLHSHNPEYGTITFTEGEDVHIAGKVLGKGDKDDWADEESFAAWQEYEQKGR